MRPFKAVFEPFIIRTVDYNLQHIIIPAEVNLLTMSLFRPKACILSTIILPTMKTASNNELLNMQKHNRRPFYIQANTYGFTLIELMITIAVAAILLVVAVPSFSGLLNSNNLITETNNLAANIGLARAEAVKRNETISIAAKTGGWANGYEIQVTSSSEVIRDISPAKNTIAPTEASGINTISFNNTGRLVTALTVFTICKASGEEGRTISIALTGRLSIAPLATCT